MDLCAKKGHDFRPFDDRALYCPRCGEFRTAPLPYYTPLPVWPYWPQWTYPYRPNLPWIVTSGTVTSDPLIGSSITVTYDNTDGQSTVIS